MSHDGWCSPKMKQLFLRIMNIPNMTQVSLLFGLGNFCTVLFFFNVGVTSRVSRSKIKLTKIKIITFWHADHQQLSFRIFFNSDKVLLWCIRYQCREIRIWYRKSLPQQREYVLIYDVKVFS